MIQYGRIIPADKITVFVKYYSILGMECLQLGNLLVQRHPFYQIFNPFIHRNGRIPVFGKFA